MGIGQFQHDFSAYGCGQIGPIVDRDQKRTRTPDHASGIEDIEIIEKPACAYAVTRLLGQPVDDHPIGHGCSAGRIDTPACIVWTIS